MGKILIATTGKIRESVLSSGPVAPKLGIENLKRRNPTQGTRLLNLAEAWIAIDLGAAMPINLIAPLYVQATLAATWRVRAANDANAVIDAPLYDSGPMVLSNALGLAHRGGAVHGQKFLGASSVTARFWRVDFDDPTNPAGYLDLGALVMDRGFQPDLNIGFGWSVGLVDPSRKAKAISGAVSPTMRRKYMTGQIAFECQSQDMAYGQLFAIDQEVGVTEPVLLIRDPDLPEQYRQQQTIFGLLTELQPIVNDHFELFSKRFEIEELVA